MVIYKFDPKSLNYKPIPYIKNTTKILLSLVMLFCVLGITTSKSPSSSTNIESLFIDVNLGEFNEDKLVSKIKELNFKFPHIVLAQSKLESNNYTSNIFRESNNMFGMKEAKVRLNLAKGTQFGHAYYDNWEDSVLDYALYASSYLHKCKSEEQYFSLLGQIYAEDPDYVSSLKRIIRTENLKSIFE
jgi:hypothetical protein